MSSHARFEILVCGCPALFVEAPDRNGWMVEIAARVFHVSFVPTREEICVATTVYLTDGDRNLICEDLIAEFNAWHMSHGGYRLAVDPLTHALYVCATRALSRLESKGLLDFLDDFARRSASCTNWYADEIFTRLSQSARPRFDAVRC